MGTRAKSKSVLRRSGFTLVELLVVIVILLVLASLVVAFAPRLAERQKVSRGAELLQQWLLTAKTRAKRDRLPTGIRLFTDGAGGPVTEIQYIQKPDDFNGGTVNVTAAAPTVVNATGANFFGGYTANPELRPVQPGDYIEFKGGGLVHYIQAVPANNRLNLLPTSPVANAIQPTADYRIIRRPRVLTGEPALEMPKDVAIDIGLSAMLRTIVSPPPATAVDEPVANLADSTRAIDILFSPSGEVIGSASVKTAVCLWVRDVSLDRFADAMNDQPLGEPTLIVIYPKSGFIAAHPVNWNHLDYYQFARDGRSSGL